MNPFAVSEEIMALCEEAERFATEVLAPSARPAEREGRWSREILDVLAGFSLGELDIPHELGGLGIGSFAKVVLLETLAQGDAGGLPAADPAGLAAGALVACKDRDVAAKVAASCLQGEAGSALVVTEPDAAEPPEAPRIEWTPSWPGLRWAWISQGDVLRLVRASTALEPTRALAFHASGGASGVLGSFDLAGEWTLEPGGGLTLRGRARLWASAVAIGVAQAAFDATIAYTKERIVFGKPVAHHQGNAFDLAAAATQLHGARLMVRDAATAYDCRQTHAGFWATQGWLVAMDAAITITDLGIQLLGGHGFLVDHLAEKRFREARMLALLAGGRDSAESDVASQVLEVGDPLFEAFENAGEDPRP